MNKPAQQILKRLQEIRKDNDFHGSHNSQDFTWLVWTILELTEGLQRVSKDFGTDYCDGKTMIAQDALERVASSVEVEE